MATKRRWRGLFHIIRSILDGEGFHLTNRGLERARERDQAALVREQRAEIERLRAERERRGGWQ